MHCFLPLSNIFSKSSQLGAELAAVFPLQVPLQLIMERLANISIGLMMTHLVGTLPFEGDQMCRIMEAYLNKEFHFLQKKMPCLSAW